MGGGGSAFVWTRRARAAGDGYWEKKGAGAVMGVTGAENCEKRGAGAGAGANPAVGIPAVPDIETDERYIDVKADAGGWFKVSKTEDEGGWMKKLL